MKILKIPVCLVAVLSAMQAFAQDIPPIAYPPATNTRNQHAYIDSAKQRDLVDVILKILDKNATPDKREAPKKDNFSIIPYAGYTLSTGFTADISGNVSFYTATGHRQNNSIIAADVGYDTKSQTTFLTRSELWTNNNDYKIVTDIRFQKYPTDTYGLGTFTTFANENDLDYYYFRLYETVLKKIAANFYAGIGYNFDRHYDITATGNLNNTVSDYGQYGQTTQSTSSGFNVDFLYDSRSNQLSPLGGIFANFTFRQNLKAMGSDANWQSVQVDLRKYIRLSPGSNNVLALWSMAAFTSGKVPYLDLPATGGDMYNNSGRGYAIGRFRGKNELYFEAEYRFGITNNGLLGAVIFANGQSFSEFKTNAFERMAPAAGGGLRLKINKRSNTNICIDYGVGTGGSHGFFVNLGELF